MTPQEAMDRIDVLLSHVWMVRTFVKHSEEAEEDDELRGIPRALYDYCLALGSAFEARDAEKYLRQAHKKFAKLRRAVADFTEIQPDVSDHTNFKMAVRSLSDAVEEIGRVLQQIRPGGSTASGGES